VGVIASPGGACHPYRIVTSIFADLLNRYPDRWATLSPRRHTPALTDTRRLFLFTQTPCTGITPPSAVTPYYTVQTPRGTITAHHIIHATNGWASHLLPGLRGKIIPVRGVMSAQRPGTGLPTSAAGSRAHTFYYTPPGFDYLTQLPGHEGKGNGEGGELLFGGGAAQEGRFVLSEVGVADDSGYHLGIASHIQGALPEHFGRENWGPESVDVSREEGGDDEAWGQGRVKALWTVILGISADMQPWVGRVPSVISCRAAAPSPLTTASDKGATRPLAPPGEWVSAGYSGEGMVHAWLCAHALALMVLGQDKEGMHTWFPDEYRLTEKRWKKATVERLMVKF